MIERLQKQLQFIIEIDKVKSVFRKTRLFDNSRQENDAEHSWHLAIMALLLAEHANEPVDVLKVIKMVLIHDLVEIDAGDFIVYTDQTSQKKQMETAAAERIFGMLPQDQQSEFRELWDEFEERCTAESKFAAAIDRLEPVMQNYMTEGYTWKKHNISSDQVKRVNRKIEDGSKVLWEYALSIISESIQKGYFQS